MIFISFFNRSFSLFNFSILVLICSLSELLLFTDIGVSGGLPPIISGCFLRVWFINERYVGKLPFFKQPYLGVGAIFVLITAGNSFMAGFMLSVILFNVIVSILINVANVKEIMEYIHLVLFLNMLVLMYVLLPEKTGTLFNLGNN